jgi:heme-degrading monooxygenase HmoA
MVIEQVELHAAAGREEELLRFLAENRAVLESAKGFRSFLFGRGVEDPSKVMLVVGWDSLEDHKAATQRPQFQAWSGELRGFVTGASAHHFAVRE